MMGAIVQFLGDMKEVAVYFLAYDLVSWAMAKAALLTEILTRMLTLPLQNAYWVHLPISFAVCRPVKFTPGLRP